IAGAQARAAVSIRELERALERERQISAQARLMADQMSSSTNLANAERDDTQSALVNLAETLDSTRARLRDHEDQLVRRNNELGTLRRELSEARQDLAMRQEDARRAEQEAESLRAELAGQFSGEMDASSLAKLSKAGSASAIARQQIEGLRETVRQLRAEKTAAEASAARARLLLDARDENEALQVARDEFEQERRRLEARIAELEDKAETSAPRLVATDGSGDADAKAATDIADLRRSIDAMTASITAQAAVDSPEDSKINALLDSAAENGGDSTLVTSLVEARERLRRRKASQASGRVAARTAQPAEPDTRQAPASPPTPSLASLTSDFDDQTSAGDALSAKAAELSATAPKRAKQSGSKTPSAKEARAQMPKASESDLNVV
ncbi:MAG: hypothetical protein KI785_01210, partial [Devosiaceae bacterium]|nr:hypothetical protein [Devosiaceae bacterium MH13]